MQNKFIFFKFSLSLVDKKYKAFTLAEILLSLTVIGIVAAIALPSLLGNANERAWETQKKALYTRFSQSLPLLPSLNGYGELKGNLSTCQSTNSCFNDDELVDTAAESFVRDGLSKVMKITNICDNDHLSDCGLPDKIVSIKGNTNIELSSIKSLLSYNNIFSVDLTASDGVTKYTYEQINTKAAAFETVNGESILVYYNPNCSTNMYEIVRHYTQSKMCANFIYDLNGKKGPNTVGKDIGFITALYSTDPVIVAPNPYPNDASSSTITFDDAATLCKNANDNSRLPNLEELRSLVYNKKLLGLEWDRYWSSTKQDSTTIWTDSAWSGLSSAQPHNWTHRVRCIKRQ